MAVCVGCAELLHHLVAREVEPYRVEPDEPGEVDGGRRRPGPVAPVDDDEPVAAEADVAQTQIAGRYPHR